MKKAIINYILLVLLVALLILMSVIIRNDVKNTQNKATNELVLRGINYGSNVSPTGYTTADAIVANFVQAYNEKSGEGVVSLFNLVGTYIYSECEKDIDKFDQTYEDILAVGSTTYSDEDFIIMQYSLKSEEARMIQAISEVNVQLELISNTQIEDLTKYISKFTADIHTYSEVEGIDQTDTLEFVLLKNGEAYYLIDYYAIGNEESTAE